MKIHWEYQEPRRAEQPFPRLELWLPAGAKAPGEWEAIVLKESHSRGVILAARGSCSHLTKCSWQLTLTAANDGESESVGRPSRLPCRTVQRRRLR